MIGTTRLMGPRLSRDLLKLLNLAVLEDLRGVLSADDLSDLLRQLSRDLIVDSLEIVSLAHASSWNELALLAHRQAGTLANFGCDALAASMRQIEAELRADPPSPPDTHALNQIVALAKETAAALHQASA